MNPSPAYSSSSMPISAPGADQVSHHQLSSDQSPYSATVATRVYEGVTIAAILLLLGSLWVF